MTVKRWAIRRESRGLWRDQVPEAQRRLEVGRRSSFAACSRGIEHRWKNSFPLAINSRVVDKIQERKRYQGQACCKEANPHHESVQQMARVSAHQRCYCYRGAILQGPYALAADRTVIREAGVTSQQGEQESRYRGTRLHIEIEIYTQG
jgi:hypothetical protein